MSEYETGVYTLRIYASMSIYELNYFKTARFPSVYSTMVKTLHTEGITIIL